MKMKSIVAVLVLIMIIGVGVISQASPVFAISSEDTKADITYVQHINNVKVGETAKIKVTVKNTGTTTFHSKVRAYLYADGHYICSKSLDGLKPGQTGTVELEYTPTEAGTQEYRSRVKEKVGGTKVVLATSNTYSFVVEYGDILYHIEGQDGTESYSTTAKEPRGWWDSKYEVAAVMEKPGRRVEAKIEYDPLWFGLVDCHFKVKGYESYLPISSITGSEIITGIDEEELKNKLKNGEFPLPGEIPIGAGADVLGISDLLEEFGIRAEFGVSWIMEIISRCT